MSKSKTKSAEPSRNCQTCERLAEFRNTQRLSSPEWHNAPVPTWMSQDASSVFQSDRVKLLIVGLAPGLRGGNRTGRPFTGDWSGDLLHETLAKYGFAKLAAHANSDTGLPLVDAAITNAVRCVPPQNKPVAAEINNCRPYLINTFERFPNLCALVTLGKIAHDSTLRALGERVSAHPFGHNRRFDFDRFSVFSSYHCSRYNTNTGVLTRKMFNAVFSDVRNYLNQR